MKTITLHHVAICSSIVGTIRGEGMVGTELCTAFARQDTQALHSSFHLHNMTHIDPSKHASFLPKQSYLKPHPPKCYIPTISAPTNNIR